MGSSFLSGWGRAFIKVGNYLRQKLQSTASAVFKNLLYLLPILET